jgi:hypothetical protein
MGKWTFLYAGCQAAVAPSGAAPPFFYPKRDGRPSGQRQPMGRQLNRRYRAE